MKITKAEGYKKPNYAVAVAAAMVAVTVSGCGSVGYAGDISVETPPEDIVQLGGEATLAEPVIDYDGDMAMNTEPDDELQLAGDVVMIEDPELEDVSGNDKELEETGSKEYCEPYDGDLVLAGDVSICDPDEGGPVLEGGAPVYEEP